jgi:glutathione S-transferase
VLDDGRPLAESGAILWYFGEGTRFVPEDAYERAKVLQFMFFEQYDHEPTIAVARFLMSFAPDPDRYADRLPGLHERGHAALGVMETRLRDHEYLVGHRLTLADIALYGYTHVADEGGFDLAPCPGIRAWIERVAAEPGHILITD